MWINLLSTRRNLLFINLVVIGFILWLTISFLYIAINQRNQSLNLKYSQDTVQQIFLTSSQISVERSQLQSLLISKQPATLPVQKQVVQSFQDTDTQYVELRARIAEQMAQPGSAKRLPTSVDNIRSGTSKIDRIKTHLSVYRSYSMNQILLPMDERDDDLTETLLNAYKQTNETLHYLSDALSYLPDQNASTTSNLQSFIHEVVLLNDKFALKALILDRIQADSAYLDQPLLTTFEVIEAEISESLDRLISASTGINGSQRLFEQAQATRRHYFHEVAAQTSKILASATLGHVSINSQKWKTVSDNQRHEIESLVESGFHALQNLTTKEINRSTRNLIIDVFLILLCALITLASVKLNRRVKQLAYHDSLTGLPNRINFEAALMSAARSSKGKSRSHAVIFLDLDRFKSINDNYGHAIGDELIKVVAQRLKVHCSTGTVLSRLGGDEFGVLVRDIPSEDWVFSLAEKLTDSIKQEIQIRSLNLRVGASAGLSIAPEDGVCGPELLRNADIAMYHCKASSLESVYRFNQLIAQNYQHRLQLELDLKQALETDQLHLCYQPKVCTRSGQVTSVEALLRWTHPERGFVSPVEFIPIAEDLRLMGKIGDWVLSKACEQIKELEQTTGTRLGVAVNISAQQFNDEKFLQTIYKTIDQHGLSKDRLELEVTESVVMNDVKRVVSILSALKDSGITIAIDDFGTGYSSLQYLQELPLSTLKIDRAFILAFDTSTPENSVANSIIQLANLFDLETVAEGVETDEQDRKIRSLGVDHIQGYRYSKPVRIEELGNVVDEIQRSYTTTGEQKAA